METTATPLPLPDRLRVASRLGAMFVLSPEQAADVAKLYDDEREHAIFDGIAADRLMLDQVHATVRRWRRRYWGSVLVAFLCGAALAVMMVRG